MDDSSCHLREITLEKFCRLQDLRKDIKNWSFKTSLPTWVTICYGQGGTKLTYITIKLIMR